MDNFELSQCPNCHCMTKTIPKGLGRSYGYGYRCGKCGAPKMKNKSTAQNNITKSKRIDLHEKSTVQNNNE